MNATIQIQIRETKDDHNITFVPVFYAADLSKSIYSQSKEVINHFKKAIESSGVDFSYDEIRKTITMNVNALIQFAQIPINLNNYHENQKEKPSS